MTAQITYVYACVCMYALGNALLRHLGQKFSTRDQDNDVSSASCALAYKGAWWYVNCHDSNLNALYLQGRIYTDGISNSWLQWKGDFYSLKFTEMKIRPFNY